MVFKMSENKPDYAMIEAIETVENRLGIKILATAISKKANKPIKYFMEHCQACGNKWGLMFASGFKTLYPDIYDLLPDNLGGKNGIEQVETMYCLVRICGFEMDD